VRGIEVVLRRKTQMAGGGRPNRKQLVQQLARQRKKIQHKYQQRHGQNSSSPATAPTGTTTPHQQHFTMSNEMVDEAILRSSIDRLQSLLPSRKGEVNKPPNPNKFPRTRVNDIPYISSKPSVPWFTEGNNPVSLSDELRMFAAYVSVSLSLSLSSILSC
jgi:hypothetical protein